MRWAFLFGSLLVACAPAVRPMRTTVVVMPRVEATHEVEAPPSLEEGEAIARDEAVQMGAEIIAEERERIDGPAQLHLVLAQGRCYRAWVALDGPFTARVEDEHGNAVVRGDADASLWLDRVCPRWTGSFGLIVEPRESAFDLDVLLVSEP